MKKSQQLQLSISTARERLSKVVEKRNAVAQGQPVSTDILKEMDEASKAIQPLEIEFRAAMIQEDNEEKKQKTISPDSQEIEKRALVSKASIVPFILEAANNKAVEGVEHEARSALLGDEAKQGLIPFELLLPPEKIEERADTVTPVASAAVTPGAQASILERVFSRTIAARLLVSMPTVPIGTANFPVMLTGTEAANVGAGSAHGATAGSFTGFNLEPLRLQARYLFNIEDLYKLQSLEETLRRDLVATIADKMDDQILNGNGTSPQVNGFFSEIPDATALSAVTTWKTYVANFAEMVDGINGYELSDIRSVIGAGSFIFGETLYRTTNSDISAQLYMEQRTGGVTVSSRIAVKDSSNDQTNIAALTSYPGRNAIAPIWGNSMRIIRDEFTNSETGQIVLSGVVLWNFKVIRTDGFTQFKVRDA